ncbi:Nucleotide-binding, alpha-beta plait [Cynara cardunculus var. scolymus]|uniref:Nucleotide-binding, alpha-beta plait n=1 Tax=Cynara cardunculus var. scolymus TaxID=59895 RepID=A0A118JWF7_CYNCS|nr:Nucleotide-binding, alpha-beta plait [Cynara cardunculus var. scolymus]
MSRVYVGNLDPRVSEREIEDEFRTFGVIRSVWVARRPPGYAFVDFDDKRDAQDAIRELDVVMFLVPFYFSGSRSYSPRGGRSPPRRSASPPRRNNYSRSPPYRGREELPYANGDNSIL